MEKQTNKIKDGTSPILTIAMPVYNNEVCVREMIESILANTFTSWELLAIDDGSDAATVDMLREYANADERVILIQRTEQPKGAQTCRNIGLREAKGEYIVFFDSDDAITADCLQRRVDAISSRKELDFMVFPSTVLTSQGVAQSPLDKVYGYKAATDDVRNFSQRILPFVVWNNIYRVASLRNHNLYWDTNLLSLQDADYNMQALLSGLKYDYCLCPANYAYRINQSSSITGKLLSGEHRKSNIYAIEKFYSSVHEHYGQKYDDALYYGAMFVYCSRAMNTDARAFGNEIAEVIGRYDTKRGRLFSAQVNSAAVLSKILPKSVVMKIVFRNYLRHRFCEETSAGKQKQQLIDITNNK